MLPAVLHGLLELLAPRRCAACDELLVPDERGFCGGCEPLLERAPQGCGATYVFGGPIADAVRALKYRGRTEHAAMLGERLASSCGDLVGEIDAVVPVPLHTRRLRERGFNQAALLAAPVAARLGAPLDTRVLVRRRDTAAQAGLEAEGRSRNVRDCFVVRGAPPRRVLLIDDVRTTGATLSEAVAALRSAGSESVVHRVLAMRASGVEPR